LLNRLYSIQMVRPILSRPIVGGTAVCLLGVSVLTLILHQPGVALLLLIISVLFLRGAELIRHRIRAALVQPVIRSHQKGRKAEAIPSNLPVYPDYFVGRETELHKLGQLRRTSAGAPVILHGSAGVGKSRLAAMHAERQKKNLTLVWWLQAHDRSAVVLGLAELARRMQLKHDNTAEAAARAALTELSRRKDWLLVFDGARHPDDLKGLLPSGESSEVIITSRRPDWRPVGLTLEVRQLSEQDATLLLQEYSGDRNREAAAALAARVNRFPLPLVQAAGYCRQVGIGLAEYQHLYESTRIRRFRQVGSTGFEPTEVTFQLAFRAASDQDTAAAQLLRLLAFTAQSGISRGDLIRAAQTDMRPATVFMVRTWALVMPGARYLFKMASSTFPSKLRRAIAKPRRLDFLIDILLSLSLLVLDEAGCLRLDQLSQSTLRNKIAAQGIRRDRRLWRRMFAPIHWMGFSSMDWTCYWAEQRWVEIACGLVAYVFPEDVDDPETWLRCAALLPHADLIFDHATRLKMDSLHLATLRAMVAKYYYQQGRYGEAKRLNEQALKQLSRILGQQHRIIFTVTNELAVAMEADGDLAEASRLMEKNVASEVQVHGKRNLLTLGSMNILAGMLRAQGNLTDARDLLEHVLRERRRELGEDHPSTLASMNNLALVLQAQGNLADARKLLERALRESVQLHREQYPDTAIGIRNLAAVLRDQKDLLGARRLYEQALETQRRILGNDHPDTVGTLGALAEVLEELGDADGASSIRRQLPDLHSQGPVADRTPTSESVSHAPIAMVEPGDVLAGQGGPVRVRAADSGHPDSPPADSEVRRDLTHSFSSDRVAPVSRERKSLVTAVFALSDVIIGLSLAHITAVQLHAPPFIEVLLLAMGAIVSFIGLRAVRGRTPWRWLRARDRAEFERKAEQEHNASPRIILTVTLTFFVSYLFLLTVLRTVTQSGLKSNVWYLEVVGVIPLMAYLYYWLRHEDGFRTLVRVPRMSTGNSAMSERQRSFALLVPIAIYLMYLVLFIAFLTETFAAWATIWYRQGSLNVQIGFPDSSAFSAAEQFFLQSFFEAIPIFTIPATLHWTLGPTFTDSRIGALLITYKIIVILPMAYGFAMLLKSFWDALGDWWAEYESEGRGGDGQTDTMLHRDSAESGQPEPVPNGRDKISGLEASSLVGEMDSLPFSEATKIAMQFAATNYYDGTNPVDTRHILMAIMRTDMVGSWDHIWLETGDVEYLATIQISDPDAAIRSSFQGTSLTGTVTAAMEIAAELGRQHQLGLVSPGLLALTLVGSPTSAATKTLLSRSELSHGRLLALIDEAVANTGITSSELLARWKDVESTAAPLPSSAVEDHAEGTNERPAGAPTRSRRISRFTSSAALLIFGLATVSAYIAYGAVIAYFVTGWIHLPQLLQIIAAIIGGVWGWYWMGSPERHKRRLRGADHGVSLNSGRRESVG
jgi:tetratricopeptide (TPR) repeat protein